MTEDNPMFQATLTEGQTYVYGGKTYVFGVPQLVDNSTRLALKREATKSVKQGDGTQVRRVTLQMFQFVKAKVAKVVPVEIVDDGDDDELADMLQVDVIVDGNGNLVDDEGDSPDQTDAPAPGAPAKRSRARGAKA